MKSILAVFLSALLLAPMGAFIRPEPFGSMLEVSRMLEHLADSTPMGNGTADSTTSADYVDLPNTG